MRNLLIGILLVPSLSFSQIDAFRAGDAVTVSDRVHFLDVMSFFSPADSGAVRDTVGLFEGFTFADADTMQISREIYVPLYFTNIDSIQFWGYSASTTGTVVWQLDATLQVNGSAVANPDSQGVFSHVIGTGAVWDIATATSSDALVTNLNTLFDSNEGGVATIRVKRLGGHASDSYAGDSPFLFRLVFFYAAQ